jgi:hypothetical protein
VQRLTVYLDIYLGRRPPLYHKLFPQLENSTKTDIYCEVEERVKYRELTKMITETKYESGNSVSRGWNAVYVQWDLQLCRGYCLSHLFGRDCIEGVLR